MPKLKFYIPERISFLESKQDSEPKWFDVAPRRINAWMECESALPERILDLELSEEELSLIRSIVERVPAQSELAILHTGIAASYVMNLAAGKRA